MKTALLIASALLVGASSLIGCTERPVLFPNTDKELNRTAAELGSDAAKRFPYKADVPRGGTAEARAQVGYSLNTLEIVNLSHDEWTDVEVWVNRAYVVHIPHMQPGVLKKLPFKMIFNETGQYFPLDNTKTMVDKVEILRDGKLYDVTTQLAD